MAKSTLEQWRMFKAVADHGGFMQAAQQVHKSQSSIHHAVNKMEEQLGVHLFEVDGRKTVLTHAGKLLLRRINYLLSEAERFENVAQNLKEGVESTLSIAVDEAFPKEVLYEALEKVSEEFPLVHIEVIETILTGADELLRKGLATVSLSPFMLDNELSEALSDVTFVAVCGTNHTLASKASVTLEDLKNSRQIVLRDSGIEKSSDIGWLGSEQRWTVSHLTTSVELIRKNLGFAWLPESAVNAHIEEGSLVTLKLERGATRSMPIYLNFEDADSVGPVARSFIGHIRFLT
ncbi:LysR family transcriptional regulator [Idiomarina sp.]|uniref:LysR family transcriptional regulator n=1 Tax=Idiomarina sp. TaxID=1874361 RepID=UPI001E1605BA|nr:LysR family transcriptional regulator [Idiomarina sp.]MCJ8317191.1 LysR family transcriptional regulator [Idiomarina sp.]NQZ16804.1 LysR family transcriptional regulator [Idiomarina sp.]